MYLLYDLSYRVYRLKERWYTDSYSMLLEVLPRMVYCNAYNAKASYIKYILNSHGCHVCLEKKAYTQI